MLAVEAVECIAGRGLRGDRFFDFKQNYKGQATFFSWEVFLAMCRHLGLQNAPPWGMRRNILIEGVDLNSLIGSEFEVQGVRFEGTQECSPCQWMDWAIGPGAKRFLKGRGGLRVRILSSGSLCTGNGSLNLPGNRAVRQT